ncbi:MAG TPA: 4-(cytidine 5'-diphospho)-2-C-methyl-D-erythritol kinase [Myxococcota bacterium]|nr:4-(cytidine 5'-diphospho)-2-C-methyl-D-erythritol kinase [Myxococcota bacterium]
MSAARGARRVAPAKINLRLAVTGRRADGYHLVDTWLAPLLDLADVVELEPDDQAGGGGGTGAVSTAGAVQVRCPEVPALEGPDNLVARAALAYAAAAGMDVGAPRVALVLRKRIPAAAGLGGGSSDAAAALRLLEDAHGALGAARLAVVAAALGADVPFFLLDGAAEATGIGEQLRAAPGPPRGLRWAALAKPAAGLRTADVYRCYDERVAARGRSAGERGGARMGAFFNDLEPAALALCAAVAPLLEALRAGGAAVAQVSGSGSACFGLFADEAAARAAAAAVAASGAPGTWTFVSRVGGVPPAGEDGPR